MFVHLNFSSCAQDHRTIITLCSTVHSHGNLSLWLLCAIVLVSPRYAVAHFVCTYIVNKFFSHTYSYAILGLRQRRRPTTTTTQNKTRATTTTTKTTGMRGSANTLKRAPYPTYEKLKNNNNNKTRYIWISTALETTNTLRNRGTQVLIITYTFMTAKLVMIVRISKHTTSTEISCRYNLSVCCLCSMYWYIVC